VGGGLWDSNAVIFQNANLSGWTGFNARFDQTSMTDKTYPWGTPFFFRNNGKTARCQLQVKDDPNNKYVKCAVYEFAQSGADITCKRVGSAYIANWDVYFGYDFEHFKPTLPNGYTCRNLTVTVTNETDTVVTLGAANAYYGGTVVDGALLGLTAVGALPRDVSCTTTLKGRAKLFVDVNRPDSSDGVLGKSTVNVTEGSYLCFGRFRSNGSRTTVNVSDDSEVFVAGGNGDNGQDFSYLTRLTLTDGATVRGDEFRSGCEGGMAVSGITVAGTAAAVVEPPFSILRGDYSAAFAGYNNPWKLNVADVVEGTDLYLNGAIANYIGSGGAFAGRPIEKTGAGTVRLGAANSYTGSVSIVEGAILLGTNGAFNADINLTLAGGEFDAGASTNAVGTLSVISNSTLAVSAGVELSFGNSSALDWGDNRLTITGAAAAHTLRFGTDANGLSAEQMKRIRWNGNRTKLDANGYLYPYVPGVVISVY